jgi:hypothetical protein
VSHINFNVVFLGLVFTIWKNTTAPFYPAGLKLTLYGGTRGTSNRYLVKDEGLRIFVLVPGTVNSNACQDDRE